MSAFVAFHWCTNILPEIRDSLKSVYLGVNFISYKIYCNVNFIFKCEAHLYGIIPTTVVVQVVLSQSVVSDSVISWTVDHKTPLSMGFSRQEYWSELHFLLQRIFPTQGSNTCIPNLLHCRWIFYPLSHGGSHYCRTVIKLLIVIIVLLIVSAAYGTNVYTEMFSSPL